MSVKRWNATTQEAENIVGSQIEAKEIYSTSEVKTNKVWVDGKPIYRKVCSSLTSTGEVLNAWTTTGVTISNIETLIDVKAHRTQLKSIMRAVNFMLSGETIQYYVYGVTASPIDRLIVEYTKTTD